LWIAGGTTRRLIAPDAMKLLVARSGGLPGTVNRVMEAALTAGFARGDAMITAKTLSSVVGPPGPRIRRRTPHTPIPSTVPAWTMQAAAVGLLVAGASAFLYKALTERPVPTPPVVVQRLVEQPPPPAKPAETVPPALMAALMKRGNEALDLGDISAARLLFQRAAETGNAAAATALGKTYDPNFTANPSARDPARAAEWYRKAVALGDPSAADLLKRVGGR
jgi:hypothetical protein